MTIPYNLNIPDAPNNPSNDQPNMKLNTNSVAQIIGVDHIGFQNPNNPNGYHNIIHEVTQLADPAAILGVNQVYSKNYTPNYTGAQTDTQLFTRTGLGGISQLTGHFATNEGWQWLGGTLVQWGRINQVFPTNTSVNGTVVFKDRVAGCIPFPNSCFVVIPVLTRGATVVSQAANTITIIQSSLSATQFSWQVRVESSQFNGFFWIAIGN